ncbi:MAG: DUF488 family protein, partial [Methanothrix sp.]|nr:DUF488 family protein [Methanothrix sp.]
MIRLKRAYDPPEAGEGSRFLVDHLWPRGVKKEALQLDAWLKDAAPSSELRRWFGHDPAKWQEFQMCYAQELDDTPESWKPLLQAARQGDITLIYSARDEEGEIYQERRIRPSVAASSIFLPFIGQSGFFYASLMS